jgi:hypothetical protein
MEGGQTLRAGYGTYIVTFVNSGAEDATFDLTSFGFEEAVLPLSAVTISAGGAVIAGVKGAPTATALVIAVSAAALGVTVTFSGKVS